MLDKRLLALYESKRVPHLLIFHGSLYSKKKQMAELFCQKLLQTETSSHPDWHHYFPEGKLGLHTVQSMRSLCQDLALTSYRGGYQCHVVYEAERMLPASSNALLKTLEEPPKNSCIIFLCTLYNKLLPTIVSRAQTLFFADATHESSAFQKLLFSILSQSCSMDQVEHLAKSIEETKDIEKEPPSEELSAKQKQRYLQQLEGKAALQKQQRIKQLFLTVLQFYRDVWFFQQTKLFFPENEEMYKRIEKVELEHIHHWIQDAELAIERGMRLSLVLEIFFSRILKFID